MHYHTCNVVDIKLRRFSASKKFEIFKSRHGLSTKPKREQGGKNHFVVKRVLCASLAGLVASRKILAYLGKRKDDS